MILETLYKRTKTGAIQYYKVIVHTGDMGTTIVKETGQLGTTSPVFHRASINQGKNIGKANETTPEEQAESQAKSDWQKKKDEGYKSLEDLCIGHQNGGVHHGLFTINGIVQVPAKSLQEVLELTLSKFNTDASGNIKPMLAKDYTKVKNIPFPVLVQPKLDGVRCLLILNEDGMQFLSRSGKTYNTLGHIEQTIPTLDGKMYPTILDGEIYSDELNFQEIVSAVKALKPSSAQLKYRVYDVVNGDTQVKRIDFAEYMVKHINSEHIQSVLTSKVHSMEEVHAFHNKYVQDGYEGAMIRLLSGKYGQGQRSSELLKVKEFDETEFKHIAWEFGQREEDLIAVCHTLSGIEFRAKMQGTREQKKHILDLYSEYNPKRVLTVKHFGYTDNSDIPRFPVGKIIRDY
jgi:DNA ligase-1